MAQGETHDMDNRERGKRHEQDPSPGFRNGKPYAELFIKIGKSLCFYIHVF